MSYKWNINSQRSKLASFPPSNIRSSTNTILHNKRMTLNRHVWINEINNEILLLHKRKKQQKQDNPCWDQEQKSFSMLSEEPPLKYSFNKTYHTSECRVNQMISLFFSLCSLCGIILDFYVFTRWWKKWSLTSFRSFLKSRVDFLWRFLPQYQLWLRGLPLRWHIHG